MSLQNRIIYFLVIIFAILFFSTKNSYAVQINSTQLGLGIGHGSTLNYCTTDAIDNLDGNTPGVDKIIANNYVTISFCGL